MDPQEASLRCGDMEHPRTQVLNDPSFGLDLETTQWGTLKTIDGSKKIETLKGDYGKFYDNLYKAVCFDEALDVSPEMARSVMKVLELARLSNGSVLEYK